MANYLDSLLDRIENDDLRADLVREIRSLRNRKDFGLVFERHLPETLRLYSQPVRVGATVQKRAESDGSLWTVRKIIGANATIERQESDNETLSEVAATAGLVVVPEFGDAIYPGLTSLGRIERGEESRPFHTVIEAENYHALETLLYAYEGQVDCIYIDPPYNTGNPDWKYNNNYVDEADSFRHSKWLSFIEKRLKLARRLLADDSILIVTIDEHEVHNLGVLLYQMFRPQLSRQRTNTAEQVGRSSAREIQMVTIVTNTAGSMSPGRFARAEEYAFFCFFGEAGPNPMTTDLLAESKPVTQFWFPLFRSRGLNDRPSRRPNLVYPIGVDPASLRIAGVGKSLKERLAAGEVEGDLDGWLPDPNETVDGYPVVWPMLDSGEMTTWQLSAERTVALFGEGFIRVRVSKKPTGRRPFTLSYVKAGNQRKVRSGEVPIIGREENGAYILEGGSRTTIPKSTWKVASHDARSYGTTMLRALIGENPFTYPKSPYATKDSLATVLGDQPDALVLDFFAGSGTTLQSLMMLNAEDGGRRRCVLVTNNEVGDGDETALAARAGVHPGDDAWEARGIFRLVTRPRCEAAVLGHRGDGEALVGDYLDGRSLAEGFGENVEFLRLDYLDRDDVSLGRAFEAVAPLLWLKAGGVGPRIDRITRPWSFPDGAVYGVLFDPQHWASFVHAVEQRRDEARHAFVVTDSISVFQQVIAELPPGLAATMLYEDYLSTFAINTGGRS